MAGATTMSRLARRGEEAGLGREGGGAQPARRRTGAGKKARRGTTGARKGGGDRWRGRCMVRLESV